MKFLHLLAVIGVVGLKFAAAVTCENESDPDSGYNGNWCGCDDGTCWDLNTAYPYGCNPHGPYQITCP